jgi:hypothetical protein
MNPVPAYLEVSEIADANALPTRKMRRRLRNAGILEPNGPHRYHVAASRLRERLPEYYDRVFSRIALRLNEPDAG